MLVMWSLSFEQYFGPASPGAYIWILVTDGSMSAEEIPFEIVTGWRRSLPIVYMTPSSDELKTVCSLFLRTS